MGRDVTRDRPAEKQAYGETGMWQDRHATRQACGKTSLRRDRPADRCGETALGAIREPIGLARQAKEVEADREASR